MNTDSYWLAKTRVVLRRLGGEAFVMNKAEQHGRNLRIVVKAFAALRDSRATLIAALHRETVAGAVQRNAVDVAKYYRRRAPKSILAEIEALSPMETQSRIQRHVRKNLLPLLGEQAVDAFASVSHSADAIRYLVKNEQELVKMNEFARTADDTDSGDENSVDRIQDPPTMGSSIKAKNFVLH